MKLRYVTKSGKIKRGEKMKMFSYLMLFFLMLPLIAAETEVYVGDAVDQTSTEAITDSIMDSDYFIYGMIAAIVILVAVIALVLYKILSKPAAQPTWQQPTFPSRSSFPSSQSFPQRQNFPQQPSSFPPQGFPGQPQFTPPVQQPVQDPNAVYIASCLARGMTKEQIIAALVQNRWTVLQARAVVDKYLMSRR